MYCKSQKLQKFRATASSRLARLARVLATSIKSSKVICSVAEQTCSIYLADQATDDLGWWQGMTCCMKKRQAAVTDYARRTHGRHGSLERHSDGRLTVDAAAVYPNLSPASLTLDSQ